MARTQLSRTAIGTTYNVQIESYPPQDMDYLYAARALSLLGFLDVVRLMSGPKDNWPKMKPG